MALHINIPGPYKYKEQSQTHRNLGKCKHKLPEECLSNLKITKRELFIKNVLFQGHVSTVTMNLSVSTGMPEAISAYK
jgi:hypothetical protein